MKMVIIISIVLLLSISLGWGQSVGPIKVIYPNKVDVSPPLRDLVRPVPAEMLEAKEMPNQPSIYKGKGNGGSILDPVLQTSKGTRTFGPPVQNFDGITTGANPPDTNGEVGLSHYVQTVNVLLAIWDKSGNLLSGPTPINSLWSGFGGPCEFQNAGDPVVLYDQIADRWLITQFANPSSANALQCFAVSTSPDPTGTYFRYSFPTPGNDYPKFSVWDDGGSQSAYLAGIRNFSSGFQFDAYAFERDAMLAGGTARAVVFNLSALVPGANNFLPSDLEGFTLPPTGTAGVFVGIDDPSTVQNELEMVELTVDWTNINNATLTRLPDVPVAPFDGNVCFFNRNCIPQPQTNQRVDGFADAMMFRLPYRNYGTHQSIVCAHTVDVGDFQDHAGIRWHELRNTGSGWTLFQEGTFSPDSDYRWMPSISINGNGDIMVGYSVSSSTTFPSIRFTGRLVNDPLGQMTFQEGLIIAGLGSQTVSNRWGDYTDMTVDPSDDFTFWYTNEYQAQMGGPHNTRIAAFQPNNLPPLVDITVTPQPGDPVIVPPGGLVFDYDVTVDNNGSTTLNAQIWNTVSLPIGEEVGPFPKATFPQSITVPAGGTFSGTFTLEVPSRVRPNTYTFNMKVGTFPNVQLDRDTFTIIKTPGPATSEVAGGADGWEPVVVASSAKPERFVLDQNYPNPFNPSTVIRYGLPEATHVKLTVYNTLGQRVATLVDGYQSAGFKTVKWDGRDSSGHTVSAGIYVYRLEAGDRVLIKKMAFTK